MNAAVTPPTTADRPLITAILPTYRRPAQLRRAVASVLRQTEPRVRVLVLDNASGDETGAVAGELAAADPRVVYHCHDRNLGREANYQAGLARVETPYFSFMADDDALLPDFYAAALAELDRHPGTMFAALDVVSLHPTGEIVAVPALQWRPGYYAPPQGVLAMLANGFFVWTGLLFRREVIDAIGYLDTDAVIDPDYQLRAMARCPFVVARVPGALFASEGFTLQNGKGPYPFADFIWPRTQQMLRSFAAGGALPPELTRQVEQGLEARMRDRLLRDGFRQLFKDRLGDAVAIAEVLRHHYHARRPAAVLGLAIALHRGLGPGLASHLWAGLQRAWRGRPLPGTRELDRYVAEHAAAIGRANREIWYNRASLNRPESPV